VENRVFFHTAFCITTTEKPLRIFSRCSFHNRTARSITCESRNRLWKKSSVYSQLKCSDRRKSDVNSGAFTMLHSLNTKNCCYTSLHSFFSAVLYFGTAHYRGNYIKVNDSAQFCCCSVYNNNNNNHHHNHNNHMV